MDVTIKIRDSMGGGSIIDFTDTVHSVEGGLSLRDSVSPLRLQFSDNASESSTALGDQSEAVFNERRTADHSEAVRRAEEEATADNRRVADLVDNKSYTAFFEEFEEERRIASQDITLDADASLRDSRQHSIKAVDFDPRQIVPTNVERERESAMEMVRRRRSTRRTTTTSVEVKNARVARVIVPKLLVRAKKELNSEKKHPCLAQNEYIVYTKITGFRVRIIHPMEGWCSRRNKQGYLCLRKVRPVEYPLDIQQALRDLQDGLR